MKKFLKISAICLVLMLLLLYCGFLFILPNAVDLNKFKPDLQKIVKEQTNLILDFNNPKISVTPLLDAGLTVDDVNVSLPDNSTVLNAKSLKARISLPALLFLTVRVSTAEIVNPYINLEIADGKAFKVVKFFENILDEKEKTIKADVAKSEVETDEEPFIDPTSIKIVVPKVKITDYTAVINDIKTNENLKLSGNELLLGYYNGKSAYVNTLAELSLNGEKKITANLNIDTFLPEPSKLDDEDDKAQRVEIPFVNLVALYKAYDLKADIDSKIKIREKDKKIVSDGYFNIDNFSLILAGLQLPASKLHLTTSNTKAVIDTDLHITPEDKISLSGMLNYGSKPAADIKITSTEIKTNDILDLTKATLNALNIKHELNPLKCEGYFYADTYIKTDFKKLNSNGNVIINNVSLLNTKTNEYLAKINSVISLENNTLKFTDTTAEIVDTLFKIDGIIDEKSYTDIGIQMEKMPVTKIFTRFLPAEINKTYSVNDGTLNLNANIKGEMKNAIANLNACVNNLSIYDKLNKINYMNNMLTAEFTGNFKTFTGNIKNSDFKLLLNGASVNCDKLEISLGENDIILNPAEININNSSSVKVEGNIKNYIKNPVFNFDVNGNFVTNDLMQMLGELKMYFNAKGSVPVNININGDSKKQTVFAKIEADKNNFISPVTISKVEDKDTVIKTVIDLKGDRLKIKDTGFYIKKLIQDPDNPEKQTVKYEEIINVEGTLTKLNTNNPNINLLKIKMPQDLSAVINVFPKSKLNFNADLLIFGDLKAPRYRGDINLWNLSIPELFITADNLLANFEGKTLTLDLKNLLANGSDYSAKLSADLNPSKNFVIKNIDIYSGLTDADKLLKLLEEAMKYVPVSQNAAAQSGNTKQTAQSQDIPVVINSGNIDMKKIKSGTITLNDTTAKISFADNVLYLKDLITNAFEGKIKGKVSVNVLTNEIKANVSGNNLDVEKTLLDAAAMKDTLTGTTDFNADISLRGVTYEEQMKTLKGTVDFSMKDGDLGPFGKLENLILAENIRQSAFFESTIGTIINSLLSFDTAHYNTLNGKLTFNNGIAEINSIESSGNVMATYIFGNFDLLKNTIDIKLRGRLGSQISDSMGPLALLNPVNLVKATPGMSYLFGKVFFLFTEVVNNEELNQIPLLGKDIADSTSTKFQVIVRGDVAKPLTLVKSFKWLALEEDMIKAKSYISSITDSEMKNPVIDLSTLNKETLKENTKEYAKKQLKNKVESSINNSLTDEQKNILSEKVNELNTLTEGKTKSEAKTIIKDKLKNSFKSKLTNTLKELTTPVVQTETTEETTTVETARENTVSPEETNNVETNENPAETEMTQTGE